MYSNMIHFRHRHLFTFLLLFKHSITYTSSLASSYFGLKMSSSSNDAVINLLGNYKSLASNGTPFSQAEVSNIMKSIRNVTPAVKSGGSSKFQEESMQDFLSTRAHLSHKDWAVTEESADMLKTALLPDGTSIEDNEAFQTIFRRVLQEGNWFGAAEFAGGQIGTDADYKPWIVLVTGVNGIRKTTTIYETWFSDLLREALDFNKDMPVGAETILPTGRNSFFRQLDHMIAVLANEDFARLYELDDLKTYAELKDGVFTRYRKLAESLGALLLKEAKARKINAMVETSGRDVAMFKYIDHFFDDSEYNKLVLHFKVNDISHAESSVDRRMEKEISDGKNAMLSGNHQKIIDANAGGPYGSDVLKGVQAGSAKVWKSISSGTEEAGKTWYKAQIFIDADEKKPWTASAMSSDGTKGKAYTFSPRK